MSYDGRQAPNIETLLAMSDAELLDFRIAAAGSISRLRDTIQLRRFEGDFSPEHVASISTLNKVMSYWTESLARANAILCNRGVEPWPRAFVLSPEELRVAFTPTFSAMNQLLRVVQLVIDNEEEIPDTVWADLLSTYEVARAIWSDLPNRPKATDLDALAVSGLPYTYKKDN